MNGSVTRRIRNYTASYLDKILNENFWKNQNKLPNTNTRHIKSTM